VKTMFPGDWHSFFIYVFFGYLLIFPAAIAYLRLFAVSDPGQRLQIYRVALFTPFAGFILYHTVLLKRCETGILPSGLYRHLFDALCHAGFLAFSYLGPLLVALLFIGLLKTAAGAFFAFRLRQQAVTPLPEEKERINRLLTRHCFAMDLPCPEVIYSRRDDFVALTVGVTRPALVLSKPLLAEFTLSELEHILLHELAHIRRRDGFWGWLLSLLRDLTFFSPFSSLLLERCLLEKERLCDQEAVRQAGGDSIAYATTLLKAWRLLAQGQKMRNAFTTGLTGPPNSLEQRIKGLLLSAAGNQGKLPVPIFVISLATLVTVTFLYLGYLC